MTAPRLPNMGLGVLIRAMLKRASSASLPPNGLTSEYWLPALNPGHIEAYKAAMGFVGSETPLTYFYLLAQRAQLGSLLSPAFGYPIAGMIHVENDLVLATQPRLQQPLTLRVRLREDPPTEGGRVFVTCEVAMEQAGEPQVLCRSRNLAKRGRRPSGMAAVVQPEQSEWPAIGRWHLSADSGRRYARVSGDYNPIHLWSWSARPFGFRRPIIQGMASVGRAVALIETALGTAVHGVSVQFRRPIEVGSDVTLHFDRQTGGFELWSCSQCAAHGRVTPNPTP